MKKSISLIVFTFLILFVGCSPIQHGSTPTFYQNATADVPVSPSATVQIEATIQAAIQATGNVSATQTAIQADVAATNTAIQSTAMAVATQAYRATQTVLESQKKWVIFDSNELSPDGTFHLYKVRADGSGLSRLTNIEIEEGQFDISPDGQFVVFEGWKPNSQSDIYRMKLDGSDLKQLTTAAVSEFLPKWSPDGKYIVYTSDQGKDEIFLMRSDGSGKINVSSSNSTSDRIPLWSPSGKEILFHSFTASLTIDKNFKIGVSKNTSINYVYSMETKRKTPLSNNRFIDYAWSPDGSTIAITCQTGDTSSTENKNISLCLINADTLEVKPLLTQKITEKHNAYFPAWSPDGRWIAYYSQEAEQTTVDIREVTSGESVSLLSNNPTLAGFDIRTISWSPDGKQILFATFDKEIFAVQADGTNLIKLTNSGSTSSIPEWLPEQPSKVLNQTYDGLPSETTPTPSTGKPVSTEDWLTYSGKYKSLFTFQYPKDIQLIEMKNGDLLMSTPSGAVLQWSTFSWTFDHEDKDNDFKNLTCQMYASSNVLPIEKKEDPSAQIKKAGWLSGINQGYCHIEVESKLIKKVLYFFNAPMNSKIQLDRTTEQVAQVPRVTFVITVIPGDKEDPDTIFRDVIQTIKFTPMK